MQVLRRRLGQVDSGVGLVGNSPPMRRAMELVEKVAPSKASVVITGQSGTGKEMVARAIHQLSPRRDKPFIAINCSAIPSSLIESEMFGHERGAFTGADQRRLGVWELADGGTLFLDEVGEIPIELQAKFLRVLEEERLRRLGGKSEIMVDVRVISATNRDLKDEIKVGRFREDLFFRLNVFHINLAPLKERREDIPVLAQHFIDRFSREGGKKLHGISPQAMKLLTDYAWPGNIRELRNTLERAVILRSLGRIQLLRRDRRNSDGAAHGQPCVLADRNQPAAKALGKLRTLRLVRLGQQDHELVATVPGGEVGIAQLLAHGVGERDDG